MTTSPSKTVHTCNPSDPGKPLPFGRKAEAGVCPRCDELRNGAPPRTLSWVDNVRRQEQEDAQRTRDIRAHFGPHGPHARGECGPVCTYGDW
ncbi:hypothetical protein BAY61_31790 (plasmid) [Prauserella marina]|uniref:Uncharacterized protein n=1 Tax=Prauserella marina TaxID=530584 RepID=A0A222W156_9PSEU|nr:hypothetical protein [Prauserella marina]ASR39870.1 hypothetical protein BAY61_31790 [Prauserella marina]PWV71362.1 hypothetical protein DES30_11278 [Prauserella marina]SDD95774.1 hypothetical protein SAMN05421630_11534 [Prauserella marina]